MALYLNFLPLHDVRVHPNMFTIFPVHWAMGEKSRKFSSPSYVGLLRWQKHQDWWIKIQSLSNFEVYGIRFCWFFMDLGLWLMDFVDECTPFLFGFYGLWFQKMWCTLLGTNIYLSRKMFGTFEWMNFRLSRLVGYGLVPWGYILTYFCRGKSQFSKASSLSWNAHYKSISAVKVNLLQTWLSGRWDISLYSVNAQRIVSTVHTSAIPWCMFPLV